MLACMPFSVDPPGARARSWSSMSAPSTTLVRMPEELLYTRAVASSSAEPTPRSPEDVVVLLTYNNTLAETPAAVLSFLQRLAKPSGLQLFDQLKQAMKLLQADVGSQPSSHVTRDVTRRVGYALNEVHAAILEVDDDLTECQASPEDAEAVLLCRHWLKQLHTFVLGLQKDVDYITMAQPVTDQQAHVWHRLLEHAHGKLHRLLGQGAQSTGQAQQQQHAQEQEQHEQPQQQPAAAVAPGPPSSQVSGVVPLENGTMASRGSYVPTPELSYKVVCTRSPLSYTRHWAGKNCL